MSYHIAITSIPAQGHIHPTLGLVGELIARSHRVTYAVTGHHESWVKEAGAAPALYGSTISTVPEAGEFTPDDIARQPLLFLKETIAVLPQIESHFEEQRPDVILEMEISIAGGHHRRQGAGQ